MASSLQQTLPYIIDSSVKTSINTAISIVNKDFMFEKNENKYIAAIENTMKILVKSLSDVNSRDKLKTQVDSEFEKYLKGRKLKDDTVTKIKQQPNSEFLHIGLKYIQKEIIFNYNLKSGKNIIFSSCSFLENSPESDLD